MRITVIKTTPTKKRPGMCVMLLCLCAIPLFGQVSVEENQITTDSVDVFASQHTEKSRLWAGVSSVVLPGTGHSYLGRKQKAMAFLGIDALCIGAFYFFRTYTDAIYGDSRAYARRFAGASHSDMDAAYWRNLAVFNDSEEYNRALELSRLDLDEKYTARGTQWQWPLDSLREEYADMRATASKMKVVYSFFIASLAVNRVAAMIDIRNIFRSHRITVTSNASLFPSQSPQAGLRIEFSF